MKESGDEWVNRTMKEVRRRHRRKDVDSYNLYRELGKLSLYYREQRKLTEDTYYHE